jgi:dUTP pyrophosphatase
LEKKFLILKIEDANDLPTPKYQTDGASGLDLYANIKVDTIIGSKKIVLIPTGIKMSVPNGYEIQVRPRSGLAVKYGITVLNSPGTIDSDYRGEIKVLLINHGESDYTIKRGDRVAQIVIAKVEKVELELVVSIEETKRGGAGFGHTGR